MEWSDCCINLQTKQSLLCIRGVKSCMSLYVLRTIYFSYVHSVISYGIIFWGNLHFSTNIYKIQKRIIRIITNIGRHNSFRQLFKQLQILPLPSKYVFSLCSCKGQIFAFIVYVSLIDSVKLWYCTTLRYIASCTRFML